MSLMPSAPVSLAPVPLTRCPGTFIKFQNLCSNLNSHLNNVHQLRHLSIELRFQRHLIFWFVASELPRWNPATSAALQTLRMPLGEPPSNPSKAKRLGRQEAMMHLARMAAHDVPECSVGGGFIRDRIVHGMPATDVDVLVTHDARQTNAAAAVRKAAESFVKTLKTWGLHHHSTRTHRVVLGAREPVGEVAAPPFAALRSAAGRRRVTVRRRDALLLRAQLAEVSREPLRRDARELVPRVALRRLAPRARVSEAISTVPSLSRDETRSS